MKNVLFATTALVAFAGAAAADVAFSGDMLAENNSITGFAFSGSLDLTASMDFDYGVSIAVTTGATIDEAGITDFGDVKAVITTEWVTLTINGGDSADDHYSSVDGMAGTAGFAGAAVENLRADVAFGGVAASVSTDYAGASLAFGASGEFGAISFGVGYDDAGETGLNAGGSFGGFDVAVAYQTDGTETSTGVSAGTSFGATDVSVYYAMNSEALTGDAFGVSVGATFGAATVGVYYDATTVAGATPATSNMGATVDYAVSDAITVSAGWDETSGMFVAAVMAIAEGAEVGVSYDDTGADDNDDYAEGITVWFSASF